MLDVCNFTLYILTIFTAVRLKTLLPSMTSLLPESALVDWPEFACKVPLTRVLRKSLSLKGWTVMSAKVPPPTPLLSGPGLTTSVPNTSFASTASFEGNNKMSG